ncbi:hypothetical protein [uncultured Roseivirga sp.]|uniref:hypothetical protein n=1 Tax=uncultured Roseivirga sp. TaxID=543088 RepID=UPI0030D8E2EB|tara:strand:+ start:66156 stop:66662 length:507 start_codon:yes stop_codon:yes gene_type:complete
MRIKIILSALLVFAVAVSCKKESVPQKPLDFNFKVKMSKRINDATIISGFYGHLKEYVGQDSVGVPVQNSILLYDITHKEAIESVAYQSEGTTFYDLKKLKKQDIEPKLTVIPNKQGFYQFDLGDLEYCVLIEVKKNTGYYRGGMQVFKGTSDQLNDRELRIDYKSKR